MRKIRWKYDAILLLGVELDQDDRPTPEMGARMYCAMDAWCRCGGPTLVACGGVLPGKRLSEAQVMAQLLVRAGMLRERILLEEKSQDTMENMRYAAQLLGGAKGKRVLVVTSDYHVRRAVLTAMRAGFRAKGYAAVLEHDEAWKEKKRTELPYTIDMLLNWDQKSQERPKWMRMLFDLFYGKKDS